MLGNLKRAAFFVALATSSAVLAQSTGPMTNPGPLAQAAPKPAAAPGSQAVGAGEVIGGAAQTTGQVLGVAGLVAAGIVAIGALSTNENTAAPKH